ncbi:hypothetical protein ACG7TL_004807 [Trametes sanguinea]
MSIYEQLRAQQELLVGLYEQNIEGAVRLQKTLAEDILPGLVDELGLDEDDTTRAREWLNDQESIFRIYKGYPSMAARVYTNNHIQAFRVSDQIVAEILRAPGDVREVLVHHMEQLRLNLKALNEGTNPGDTDGEFVPILQYVALFDIANISVQDTNMDLITWFIFELIPRFPGMLAAVCVLNYSWAHSGVWGLVKRVLPKSALSRIFFPSRDELLQYIPRSALPHELEDPLENVIAPPCELPQPSSSEDSTPHQASSSGLQPIPRIGSIPPTSHLNPYFGYPVSGRNTLTPRLRHGRQRKRDLLRTLASLWWSRWKHRVYALLCIALALLIVISRRRPRIFGWKQPSLTARCRPACAGRAKINIAGLRMVSTAAETNWVWVWSGRGASMPSADVEVVALLAKTV